MASLTDTTHKMEGVTVLYIPKEGADLTPEQASKNKDLVQRLESKQFLYIIILFQKII